MHPSSESGRHKVRAEKGPRKPPPTGDVDPWGDALRALTRRIASVIPAESPVCPEVQAELVAEVVMHRRRLALR